jgi:hypothetical protein
MYNNNDNNNMTQQILVKFYATSISKHARWVDLDIDGLFITTPEELKTLYGKNILFIKKYYNYQVEVNIEKIKESHFEIISTDQDFIKKLEDLLGNSISGYNPFDHIGA